MRLLLPLLLACLAVPCQALETSLVMTQQDGSGGFVGIANPENGSLRVYQGGTNKFDLLDSTSFYNDVYYYGNMPHPQVATYSMLRVGHNTSPSYNEMINQRLLGSRERYNAAANGENAWWAEAPEYDGIARGDFATNSLFLVVPAYRAALLYTLQNNRLELTSFRNIGPDFYLPQGLKTEPAPEDLLRGLPREQRDQYKEMFEERQQALADDPDSGIQLEAMDPWVRAISATQFVVLDPANQRLLSYRIQQGAIVLTAARNLEIDLMVPPEASFNTRPSPAEQYKLYERSMRKANHTPYSPEELQALLATAQLEGVTKAQGEPVHAGIDNKDNLVVDFTAKHKVLYYKPDAGNGSIQLFAVRDYSLESAINIHTEMIRRSMRGKEAYQNAVAYARRRGDAEIAAAKQSLQLALTYNPGLYEEAEKESAFRRAKLNEDAFWKPMIDAAIAEAKEQQEAEKRRQEQLKQQ
ncbi:MAG: hypothetical protein ACOCXA_08270 [Planctomycetota bacterium]